MTSHETPRRRFVPEPIETTFKSVRQTQAPGGVNPELTPEPSPQSATIPTIFTTALPKTEHGGRRRFAPQLIETSRRTFRLGDSGPATRPTDKTDITPYTNHIYNARSKKRRQSDEEHELAPQPPTRRESEDEGVQEYLLELAAKEADRQMQEEALAAFPNSRAREGGVAHFYFHDGSSSDESRNGSPGDQQNLQRIRRKSSNLGLNWWHKHMQDHAEKLVQERGNDEEAIDVDRDRDIVMRSDSDLDKMELPAPPDPLWTTNKSIAPENRRDSMAEEASIWTQAGRQTRDRLHDTSTAHGPAIHLLPEGAPPQASNRFLAPATPETPASDGPFGRPFASLGLKPDEAQLRRLRQLRSPPMLGKELNFRKCPSPKQTKLETDHPFSKSNAVREENRDISGQGGLWRGYCCRSESIGGYIVPANLQPQRMLATPYPSSPREEQSEFDFQTESVCEEPNSLLSATASSDPSSFLIGSRPNGGDSRPRNSQPKGLHMLHGLNERLQQEKARAERDEKIVNEFDDAFVTQVYNYLSLGYPAMARGYDEEISKITRVSVEELGRNDEAQMAKGHMLEMKLEDNPEEARCPRWKALRLYIMEWARQHPNLDDLDPLAWGVRERRGSWAI